MQPDDAVRFRHMWDAAQEALSFVNGKTRGELETDRQLALSLVKEVEIIGEAAHQVSESTRLEHPDLPWNEMAGMRHHLVHAYFDIDLDIVWRTVTEDLPRLIAALEPVLAKLPKAQS
ncbi:MAG: DUF86 domain-containing protein [Deltaproteobacteria bacterium]|nr:DUF86 domain-containing protein [Deltaproteobacteria bacterium]